MDPQGRRTLRAPRWWGEAIRMAEPTTLDELDVKILRLLNSDARKSYRDIAKATDASISTVSSRVRKDRKSTRLNSSHRCISYAVFCLKKKKKKQRAQIN